MNRQERRAARAKLRKQGKSKKYQVRIDCSRDDIAEQCYRQLTPLLISMVGHRRSVTLQLMCWRSICDGGGAGP